jgi:bacteriocin biosynthesis cyclodehydratase domain-containing protein
VRLMVRPGLKILRRDARTLQLGFDWPGVAAVLDTESVRSVLAAIDGVRDHRAVLAAAASSGVPIEACQEALALLLECGAVVDAGGQPASELSEGTSAALWLLAGPRRGLIDVLAARERRAVWVVGDGAVTDTVRALTVSAGLRLCDDPDRAEVGVLAGDREPSRDLADAVLRAGVPHLWAYLRDLAGVIGPFVVPGRTACLRCVDAARTEADPAWPTLLQSTAVRPLRVAACDGVQATLVAAWAAQEVALWASDVRPRTRGRVIEVPMGGPVEESHFDPHPACGCGWLEWRDTIGA